MGKYETKKTKRRKRRNVGKLLSGCQSRCTVGVDRDYAGVDKASAPSRDASGLAQQLHRDDPHSR